jgi:hypothetical protein
MFLLLRADLSGLFGTEQNETIHSAERCEGQEGMGGATMIHHYHACSIRSRPRAVSSEACRYTYEVVVVFTTAGSLRQVRHEHQGEPFSDPLEAQQAGLRWAMTAIDTDFRER